MPLHSLPMTASTCSSGADRSTKNAGVGRSIQGSSAATPKSADGHGDERCDAATRHQPVAGKEKRRPSYIMDEMRNERERRARIGIGACFITSTCCLCRRRAPASQHPSKDGAPCYPWRKLWIAEPSSSATKFASLSFAAA